MLEVTNEMMQEFRRVTPFVFITPAELRAGLTAVFRMPDVHREIVLAWRDDQEAGRSEMEAQRVQEHRHQERLGVLYDEEPF